MIPNRRLARLYALLICAHLIACNHDVPVLTGTYVGRAGGNVMLIELHPGNRYFLTFGADSEGSTGIYSVARDTVYLSYERSVMTFVGSRDSLIWQDFPEAVLRRQSDP
jgi:hypothetical protein